MLVHMAVNDISMTVGMLMQVFVLALVFMGMRMFPFHGSLLFGFYCDCGFSENETTPDSAIILCKPPCQ
jgi:hypothetical protein